MKIYVTRHGETVWNFENRLCGSTDIELTPKGIGQAQALAKTLGGRGIEAIIASPLKRARQTAQILAQAIGLPVQTDARLQEQNYGQLEGQSCNKPAYIQQKYQICRKMPGGESPMQMAQRIYNALDEIIAKYQGKTVLLVCHGSAARVLNTYFEDMTQQEFEAFYTDNCELREYELPL